MNVFSLKATRSLCAILLFLFLSVCSALAESSDTAPPENEKSSEVKEEERSLLVGTLLYLPNRVLDLLDIFRLRVRVGPGFAVGARATEVASAYLGSYMSVYAGLPGPRLRSLPRSPLWLESYNGVSLSVADATASGGLGPDYSPTELGAGFQLGVAGVDFGVDPVEVLDFVTGFVTIDLRDDDL